LIHHAGHCRTFIFLKSANRGSCVIIRDAIDFTDFVAFGLQSLFDCLHVVL